jgi:hypothetical protein
MMISGILPVRVSCFHPSGACMWPSQKHRSFPPHSCTPPTSTQSQPIPPQRLWSEYKYKRPFPEASTQSTERRWVLRGPLQSCGRHGRGRRSKRRHYSQHPPRQVPVTLFAYYNNFDALFTAPAQVDAFHCIQKFQKFPRTIHSIRLGGSLKRDQSECRFSRDQYSQVN